MITLALVDIVLMWGAILVTISMFFLKSPIASYLLIPYILWVTLATYLNAYIVRNNEDPSRAKCKNQQRQ
jgi:tryptophan-rich sensory protein